LNGHTFSRTAPGSTSNCALARQSSGDQLSVHFDVDALEALDVIDDVGLFDAVECAVLTYG
jgi:hypothetical protein